MSRLTSSTGRCRPRFPARGVLLDNSAIDRLWKCEALDCLAGTVELHVVRHVAKEFGRLGPAERAALDKLGAIKEAVTPGAPAEGHLALLRPESRSTRDLGEDESLAVALAKAAEGEHLPFVTYDGRAGKKADSVRRRDARLPRHAGVARGVWRPHGETRRRESRRGRRRSTGGGALPVTQEGWRPCETCGRPPSATAFSARVPPCLRDRCMQAPPR